tara:strand:+ start:396 stop:596 length:201 start_codon:yes stop_codon:yes gene_type:complete
MIHQINQPLAQNVIPARGYENIPLAITARRAFDMNPMPSRRYKDITSANHSKEGIQGNGGIGGLIP